MKCIKCNIEKEESDFVFRNKAEGIKHSICKDCQKPYKLKHYYNNKQQYYNRNNKTEQRLKDYILDYKLNHPCPCGEKDPVCLDFHHLRDKDDTISLMSQKGSMKKLIEEINKCTILCSNCHRKLHKQASVV